MAEAPEQTPPTTPTEPAPAPPAPDPAPPEPTPAPEPPAPEPEPTPAEPARQPAQPETPPAQPAAREEPLRAPGMAALQSEREARRESDRKAAHAERMANLAMALGEKGVVGGKMKAALRLVDVKYDADNQPVDLDKALETAAEAYDTQFVAAPAPQPTYGRVNGMPDVHQGPRRPAAPDEDAQFAGAMRGLFPHISTPSPTAE